MAVLASTDVHGDIRVKGEVKSEENISEKGVNLEDKYVNISQVKTDVPAGAKFTDTIATKTSVGLGNVDNTSDASKPVSTATKTALDGKVNNNQVLTNVPANAKFTDTVTTVNKSNVEAALEYKIRFYNKGDTIPTLPADTIAMIREV